MHAEVVAVASCVSVVPVRYPMLKPDMHEVVTVDEQAGLLAKLCVHAA